MSRKASIPIPPHDGPVRGPDPGIPGDKITLVRRGAAPVRMEARLVDEVGVPASPGQGAMRLRLWQGRNKLAVEVVLDWPGGPVLDAAAAPGVEGIADWLESLDPSAPVDERPRGAEGVAATLWAEAVRAQQRADFQWLVGEALYRWNGLSGQPAAGMETAA